MSEIEQHIVSSPEQSVQTDDKKVSRISDTKIAFIQQAYAYSADESLDERRRIFLAHGVTKPHLTLQELAPFAGITTESRASRIWNTALQKLWQASPPDLQQQYPLDFLLSKRSAGVPFSPVTRARMKEANRGKISPETRARLSEAKKEKKRKPFTAEHKARMSKAALNRWAKRWKQEQAEQSAQSEDYGKLMERWYYPAEQVVFDADSPRE